MDLHAEILKKLCRVCGNYVTLNEKYTKPISVESFTNELYSCCGVSIETDDDTVAPKTLCQKCYLKFHKLRKSRKIKQIDAVSFKIHTSENCDICKVSQHVDGYNKTVRLAHLDKEFLQVGFVKCLEMGGENKRIYVKTSCSGMINEITVIIRNDFGVRCNVYTNDVDLSLFGLPAFICDGTVKLFTNFYNDTHVCPGISGFENTIVSKLTIDSVTSNATVESNEHIPLLEKNIYSIIRAKDCRLLIKKDICDLCSQLKRNTLPSIRSRVHNYQSDETKVKRISDTSHTPLIHLDKEELILRLKNVQQQKKAAIRKVATLSKRVADIVAAESVEVEKDLNNLVRNVMDTNNEIGFDEDTPQCLLWQQQKQFCSKSDARGMRWHPLIIRWCLSIYYTSPAAYKQVSSKRLNFLRLPTIETLKKYLHSTQPKTGFNPDIIKRLVIDSGLGNLADFEKQVSVVFDEMKIKSDLIYHRSTGQIVGFTDLGDINSELMTFQKNVEEGDALHDQTKDLANHVIVYMARGIFTNLIYPFGYFASRGMTGSQLYLCTTEAIDVLTRIGFDVRALVADGASPNRKLFQILSYEGDKGYWTWNPHKPSIKTYFISDVPHLLKTTRNCFENSCWNKATRTMLLDKQDISWKHIVDLYEEDLGVSEEGNCERIALGLRKLHKLREEHVKLTPRTRMTVKLAAQVLSQTTANALISQGKHDTKSTVIFIQMFDRVFDCLNVSGFRRGKHQKKELQPYSSPDDWRFEFLIKEFLENFLKRWEDQVAAIVGMKQDEKMRLMMSHQTITGWRITINSFVELAKELLKMNGVKFLLSEKLSQDPLEEYFGQQRRKGGCNENPSLEQFSQQHIALNVMRSDLIQDMRGNTRGRTKDKRKIDVTDERQLPKKKR